MGCASIRNISETGAQTQPIQSKNTAESNPKNISSPGIVIARTRTRTNVYEIKLLPCLY